MNGILNYILAFVSAHQTASTLAAYYIFSAFVGALPAPTATSSMLYQWFFKFFNTLGGNLARAVTTRVEKSPNFQDALVLQLQRPPEIAPLPPKV